jgi:3-oxoadipate enol-lactonase
VHVIERTGRGPTVVYVHGFCQSSAYWAPTLERVAAQGVGALALDLPGFASSSREPGPYTMPALADAVAAVLDRRRLSQIILVGGSMGGVVAQHFALRHPDRVLRLLLVATGAFTADPQAALVKADAMASAPWNEATVTPVVAGFFYRMPPPDQVATYRSIALQASQPAAVEAARSNATLRTFEDLGRIAMPTLIIQGHHDRARTPEHGGAMKERLPNARLEIIEEAGHTPQLEQPERFHKIALPFLLTA